MSLTADQARALWAAGGFAILTGLPPRSETGIDGSLHAVKAFAGHKFVPPGFHAVVWSAEPTGAATSSSSGTGTSTSTSTDPGTTVAVGSSGTSTAPPRPSPADIAAAFPLRSALLHIWAPRERVVLSYDPTTETTTRLPSTITDAELIGLDAQLAPYPFPQLEPWKKLTTHVTAQVLQHVLGNSGGQVDSMMAAAGEDEGGEGDDEEAKAIKQLRAMIQSNEKEEGEAAGVLEYPRFELKRSWPEGASGEEVTKWSRDKSKLLTRVCGDVGGPATLLGILQLSHILVVQVWSYSSLAPYKRILSLLCRSGSGMADPSSVGLPDQPTRDTYVALLHTLAAQLRALPADAGAFEAEMPGMREFYVAEIEELRKGLGHALGERGWWGRVAEVAAGWSVLRAAVKERGWGNVGEVSAGDEDSEEEEEEGEYAPVVVDI